MRSDGPLYPDPPPPSDFVAWEVVETRVLGRAMAQVFCKNEQNGRAPYYSIRVGTAQLLDDGTTRVSGPISIYHAEDAADLLIELSRKYQELRESQGAPRRDERRDIGIAKQYRRSR